MHGTARPQLGALGGVCVQSDGPQVANLPCSCPFLQGEGLSLIVVRLLAWINQQFEPEEENAALSILLSQDCSWY